jgi:hypothetical protein
VVWVNSSTLWIHVAQALGFSVIALYTKDATFGNVIGKELPELHIEAPPESDDWSKSVITEVDLVFTDLQVVQSLPKAYWETTRQIHLATMRREDSWEPPEDWTLMVKRFRHADLGGATAGYFELALVLRTTRYQDSSRLELPPVAWTPISSYVNSVEQATPVSAGSKLETALDCVEEPDPKGSVVNVGGCIHSKGLAPRGIKRSKVIVQCVFYPLRECFRHLTTLEVAGLWDVPILLAESLSKRRGQDGLNVLEELCEGHPSKVLYRAGDYLLSNYVRGGFGVNVLAKKQGPAPTELVRIHLAQAEAARLAAEEERLQSEILNVAVPPNRLELDGGANLVKQEGQKADAAPVHTLLWDSMFLRSGYVERKKTGHLTLKKLEELWVNPTEMVIVKPTEDVRDAKFSDTQLECELVLPRWRWALFKIRAAVLRWCRRRLQRSALAFTKGLGVRSGHPRKLASSYVEASKSAEGKFVPPFHWRGERVTPPGVIRPGKRDYQAFWKEERNRSEGTTRSLLVAKDCVRRAADAVWWEWSAGSTLNFWNWSSAWFYWARDGQEHFVVGELPTSIRRQSAAKDKNMMKRMISKVNKVRQKGYIDQLDGVQSITHMFPVPKGKTDIRMVYNGTSSGLNASLWAPHFGLPMVEHTLRSLLGGYHQADLDVAEMFLCFKIHPDLRPYAGVDVKLVKNKRPEPWEVGRNRDFEAWYRNFMGMKDSPYRSIQMMLRAKVEAYGDRKQHDNPFGWDRVVLNLPGNPQFDSSLPKVMKVRKDHHIASEIYVYVDDARVTAWCKEECWRATCQFSRTLTRLGIQDASRKRTEASMKPGIHSPERGAASIPESHISRHNSWLTDDLNQDRCNSNSRSKCNPPSGRTRNFCSKYVNKLRRPDSSLLFMLVHC